MFDLCQYIKKIIYKQYLAGTYITVGTRLLLLYCYSMISYTINLLTMVKEKQLYKRWVLSWVIHTHRPHPFVYLCSVFLVTPKYVYATVNFLCLVGFLYNWVRLIGKSLIIILLWYFYKQSTFSSSLLNPSN